jgi:hypothetical protein
MSDLRAELAAVKAEAAAAHEQRKLDKRRKAAAARAGARHNVTLTAHGRSGHNCWAVVDGRELLGYVGPHSGGRWEATVAQPAPRRAVEAGWRAGASSVAPDQTAAVGWLCNPDGGPLMGAPGRQARPADYRPTRRRVRQS